MNHPPVDDDGDGGSHESVFRYVVVNDHAGRFVTAAGWIDSPAGALTADLSLTGRAIFGFNSKYKKGAATPTGQTEFQFKVAHLNFRSTEYQWLVVAGARAQYKGTGTINGAGNYAFKLTAIDEKLTPSTDTDLFRIKIWDQDIGDAETPGALVYDNEPGVDDDSRPTTAITKGSIVIHK